jgi:integrase
MPSLFKSRTVAYRDPGGKKCQKGDPGARKVVIVSKVWYGRYKDADGRTRTVPLCADKSAAKQLLAKLVTEAAEVRGGVRNPTALKHRARPLLEHLKDFKAALLAKGGSAKHAGQTYSRAKKVVEGCKFERLGDVQASAVLEWLAEQRKKSADRRCECGISVQTSNFYLQAVKQFCRWLVKDRRAADNPLAYLEGGNTKLDRRHDRRHLPPAELRRLLTAARGSEKTFRGLTGPNRFVIYLTGMGTGLRSGELASLTPESFDLAGDVPVVYVRPGYTKNKKPVSQPLPAELVEVLREYLPGRPAGEPLWPGTWHEKGADMLKIDLGAAGIPYEVAGPDDPLFADFHALRHSYITMLARGGVGVKDAQELARHSDIRLTMQRYAHATLHDLAGAVGKLPSVLPPPPADGREPATGSYPVRTGFVQTGDGLRGNVSGTGTETEQAKAS